MLDDGARTRVHARVWVDGQTAPAEDQLEGHDSSPTRLTAGYFGLVAGTSANTTVRRMATGFTWAPWTP